MDLAMIDVSGARPASNERVAAPAELIVTPAMTIIELFGRAEKLETGGNAAAAVALYKNWIAKNPAHELLHAAYFNYGVILNKAGDRYAAMNVLRECLRIKPDFLPAHINLGRLLEDDGQAGAAVSQWLALVDQTSAITGDAVKHKLVALQQLGRVLEGFQQDNSAEDALRQALDINAAQPEVIQHWISLRQRQCKWPVIAGSDNVGPAVLMAGISPLSLAALDDDPMYQLARAYKYSKEQIGRPKAPLCPRNTARHRERPGKKLRIGYVSSDLREHAVGFAMTDVMETHDRDQFEVSAYYCGIDRVDATQLRTKNSVDRWVDINKMTDEEAAATIHGHGIDILIDLNGYTKDARSRLFAYRPAPIIVNWFGYPGTMGSTSHDYIIADPFVIPQDEEIFYSEKVVRLPCYQPNDRKRVVAAERPTRSDAGLPEDAFVFCGFNGCQKITPAMLQNWIVILHQVPGSVLWLLSGNADTNDRLRQYAAQAGITPERLVFADKKPNPQHLARYVLADLFLDTFPYGAHTTASDAMWMGVPVLTYPGKSFASRVCASLVNAAGLGDLVCDGPESYIARAADLGRHPAKTEALKARLRSARSSSTLFDTTLLVRELEKLYIGMWAEALDGMTPVPDLSNLEDYFEIGLDTATSRNIPGTLPELNAHYRSKLGERHAAHPVPPDRRLWTEHAVKTYSQRGV